MSRGVIWDSGCGDYCRTGEDRKIDGSMADCVRRYVDIHEYIMREEGAAGCRLISVRLKIDLLYCQYYACPVGIGFASLQSTIEA